MPGGHPSQDRPPATDPVSGGPSATLAVAQNDKLDWIAQRFNQFEHIKTQLNVILMKWHNNYNYCCNGHGNVMRQSKL